MDSPLLSSISHMETFIELLHKGDLIGLPTETVYGLAGNALMDEAVLKIYALKNRPSINPLIIHVDTLEKAQRYGVFDEIALKVAQHFWPPSPSASSLTLVVPLQPHAAISRYVTAGLDTIAIRIPHHPVALDLLSHCDFPVAAPSANLSTQLSPTKRAHIVFERIPVLDAGPCQIGIESTILFGSTILRPGIVTASQIEKVIGKPVAYNKNSTTIQAPGMMKKHYSPATPIILNSLDYDLKTEALLGFGQMSCTLNLSPRGDIHEAIHNLFSHLHLLDQQGYTRIHVAPLPQDHELSLGLYDKLHRMVEKEEYI